MTVRNKRIDLRASQKDEKNLQAVAAKLKTRTITDTVFEAVAAVAENEPELFLVDREKIQLVTDMAEFGKKHFQALIDEYKKVTSLDITLDELKKILAPIGSLGSAKKLRQAIYETVREGQFNRMQKKYPDLIITNSNLPELDISGLVEITHKIEDYPVFNLGSRPFIQWQTIGLQDGKIIIDEKKVELSRNGYRHYAETPEEKRKLSLVRKLCQALNAINETGEINPDHISKLFYFDPVAARFEPTGGWIKFSVDPHHLIKIEES